MTPPRAPATEAPKTKNNEEISDTPLTDDVSVAEGARREEAQARKYRLQSIAARLIAKHDTSYYHHLDLAISSSPQTALEMLAPLIDGTNGAMRPSAAAPILEILEHENLDTAVEAKAVKMFETLLEDPSDAVTGEARDVWVNSQARLWQIRPDIVEYINARLDPNAVGELRLPKYGFDYSKGDGLLPPQTEGIRQQTAAEHEKVLDSKRQRIKIQYQEMVRRLTEKQSQTGV